jgi:hypothetical protein
MKIWIEIQRTTGVDDCEITADGTRGIATGACPGCGATPFIVQGHGRHRHTRDTFRAGGKAMCCGDSIGYIYATTDTLFGLEEDEAVLNGRARVY